MLLYKLYEKPLNNIPEKDAVIFKGKSTSYRKLDENIKRSAFALLSLGIKRAGDSIP